MVGLWLGLSSWFADGLLLNVPSHDTQRESKLSGVSSYKGTNPIMRTHLMTSSKPNYLPKAPSPDTITLEVRISTYEFGRKGHNSVHSSGLGSRCLNKYGCSGLLPCYGEIQMTLPPKSLSLLGTLRL